MLAHLGMCNHLVVVLHVRSAVAGHQTVTINVLDQKTMSRLIKELDVRLASDFVAHAHGSTALRDLLLKAQGEHAKALH